MAHQQAVTLYAPLRAGMRNACERLLTQGSSSASPLLPFDRMPTVHFARLAILEATADLDGDPIPSALIYMADVDTSPARHLNNLVSEAPAGVDEIFAHCVGYPIRPDDASRLEWLRSRAAPAAAYYVHCVGRTVGRIIAEDQLRNRAESTADDVNADLGASPDPVTAKQAISSKVLDHPAYGWARRPAPGPGFWFTVRETAHMIGVPVLLLFALPILIPVLLTVLVVIRYKEQHDKPETGEVDFQHLEDVRQYEDFEAQNPLTAVGFAKPGAVRRATLRVALIGLNYANRHFFKRDNLAGVRTIHFARWVPLDGGRRLIFASSYDGSAESYMDDFINLLYWGINLVFSNGEGFPSTRWLVTRGCQNEIAYKNFLARHQIPTPAFYTAYPQLTAVTVDTNSVVRKGLAHRAYRTEATRWLEQL